MKGIKKSHIWASLLALAFLSAAPSLIEAAPGDIQSFSERGTDVFRVKKGGEVKVGSGGVTNDAGLAIGYYNPSNVPVSSPTYFVGSDAKISTTALFAATLGVGLGRGATTYVETNPVFTQIGLPRTISFRVLEATGFAVVRGTDVFNRVRTETIYFVSNRPANGNVPWVGVSSITVTIDTLTVTASSVTFQIGTSTGIGLPFRIDSATAVFKVLENGVHRSTISASNTGVNALESTISLSSNSWGGGKTLDVWAILRKSIFATTTPPDSVSISTP